MMRTGISTKKLLLSTLLSVSLCCFSIVVAVKADTAIWAQTYDRDTSIDWANALVATSDGGYAMVGYTSQYQGIGDYNFWLVKTDEVGNMQWNQTYGGEGGDSPGSLVATSDGGYAIIGTTDSFGAGSTDLWLIKTDAYGNVEWNQTYGGPDSERNGALIATADGGYALAGGWNCSLNSAYAWLVKTDADGNVEWNQTYGGAEYDTASALIATSDGGYALAGYTESFAVGEKDFWLIKTDANGNMVWNQTYGGELADRLGSFIATSDGGYALAGSTNISEFGNGDLWLIKTDADGNMEWDQIYGGEGPDHANSLVATSDGGYAVAGCTVSFGVEDDFWLIKTDENGVAPVVPEAAWVIMPLLATATIAILLSKKKLFRSR